MVIKKKTGTQGFRRSVTTMIEYNLLFGLLTVGPLKTNVNYQIIHKNGRGVYYNGELLSNNWGFSFDFESEMSIDSWTPLTLLVKEWL